MHQSANSDSPLPRVSFTRIRAFRRFKPIMSVSPHWKKSKTTTTYLQRERITKSSAFQRGHRQHHKHQVKPQQMPCWTLVTTVREAISSNWQILRSNRWSTLSSGKRPRRWFTTIWRSRWSVLKKWRKIFHHTSRLKSSSLRSDVNQNYTS